MPRYKGEHIAKCKECKTKRPVNKFTVYTDSRTGYTYRRPVCEICRYQKEKKRNNGRQKMRVKNLSDTYVISVLTRSGKIKMEITPELIEAKKTQLLLKRAVKQLKESDKSAKQQCKKCGEYKFLGDFYIYKGIRRLSCKQCNKNKNKNEEQIK